MIDRPTIGAVRAMVAAAFPEWAQEPIGPVAEQGTSHALYRLGADKVVRIPLLDEAVVHVAQQEAILAAFANLPLEVPLVVASVGPSDACPRPWSVLRWIEGQTLAGAGVADWQDTARKLGSFVAAMRVCDTAAGLPSGSHSARRGMPLAALDAWMRDAIAAIADLFDPAAVTAAWQSALAVPEWSGPPQWVHGDLHGANLIVRDGKLVAAIDFGLASLGDPACDLAPAWTTLPPEGRDAFRTAVSLDDDAWARGRGWGLYAGAIALAHYRGKDAFLDAMGRRAVSAVLESQ